MTTLIVDKYSSPSWWQLPEDLSFKDLMKMIDELFPIIEADITLEQEITFFDTFEWSLWHSDHYLYQIHNRYYLECKPLFYYAPLAEEESDKPVKFEWDFPEGKLKKTLKSFLNLRAIQPIITLKRVQQNLYVQNCDEKTVATLSLNNYRVNELEQYGVIQTCQLIPIKGYGKEAKQLSKLLKLQFTHSYINVLEHFLKQSNQEPYRYSVNPKFALQPHDTAREAVGEIIRVMLTVARQNENGIIQDIDSDFLHDYRVCIRRVRSLLSQSKCIYPDDEGVKLKTDFATLSKRSNLLRDYDVYLLERNAYRRLLPHPLREPLDIMFDDFTNQRQAEHAKFAAYLQSQDYQNHIQKLSDFFNDSVTLAATSHSDIEIIQLAKKKIYKQYKRIRKVGLTIAHATQDGKIHKLRIECKKLRYLLEFFSALFSANEIHFLVARLKLLQDNLGRFNDLSVQQSFLRNYLENKTEPPVNLSMAIGGLITLLYQKQVEERKKILANFQQFDDVEIQVKFKQLFKKNEE
jgi:CHAD domain-containing protein